MGLIVSGSHILLFLLQLTRAENVVDNCKARCEREKVLFYRFNPRLDEVMGSVEADSRKLCEVILKAKMLLQSNDTEMDQLIQHMYYIMAQRLLH